MSSGTDSSISLVVWAGRVLVFLAGLHLAATGLASAHHIPGWFVGDLWQRPGGLSDLGSLSPALGAFWLVWGSFAVPQALLGGLIARLGRRGEVPPPYIAVGVAAWGLVAAALFEPSPFATALIPAAMLLAAHRAANRRLATEAVR